MKTLSDLNEILRHIEHEVIVFDDNGNEDEGHGVYAALNARNLHADDGWTRLGAMHRIGGGKIVAIVIRLNRDIA